MIDAAGAIYVIGGGGGGTIFQDVWASTTGGAWPDSRGCLRRGTTGYYGVLWGYYKAGVLVGYFTDTKVYHRVVAGAFRQELGPRGAVTGSFWALNRAIKGGIHGYQGVLKLGGHLGVLD